MKVVVAWLLLVPSLASADRRMFTSTYEYRTMPEGETALELWHTESRDDFGDDPVLELEHALEVEHGITERWDASLLFGFGQVAAPMLPSGYHFREIRLQNRYRFADRSEWPIDVQLQLDVAKQLRPSVYDIELRTVLARDIDKLTVAANVTGMIAIAGDLSTSSELAWAGGASYEVHPKLNAGVETFGRVRDEHASVGPALGLAPSSKLWLTITAGFGVTEQTPALAARAILGIEL